jgi:plastocyanin
MVPNLRYALPNGKCCGKVPPTHIVHLHHGVWLSNGTAGEGEGNGYGGVYPFMASGEEKTKYEFPAGYGYPIGAKDQWILNYMIHNLTARPMKVYITYEIDFVPATEPLASTITPVHPIWMDVQDHHIYPIFNVKRGSGRAGKFTYPEMAKNPYGTGTPLNQFTIDHPGTLIATAGHLHPGGFYDDLDLTRPGASPGRGTIPGDTPGSVRLFRSRGVYFDKGKPISWDFAMTGTAPDWRPQVQAGDVLRISSTYDSRLASWYEVMGIMVVWEAWGDQRGVNPFTHTLDERGFITHGHLSENNYRGGSQWVGVNPKALAECSTHRVLIAAFRYIPSVSGNTHCLPTIKHGQEITFVSQDASPFGTFNIVAPNPFYLASIFHTVTSCKYPCALNYGIAYPLPNGAGNFDSGELGVAVPGVGRLTWSTPKSLPTGTYTFFCRIHPWMRGVFRIVGPSG